ncbi:MAG: hypothetical protein K1X83_03325 [Oligoflexia bacterium]|nr:hypothetical protein [Oligoflexia bacterium]
MSSTTLKPRATIPGVGALLMATISAALTFAATFLCLALPYALFQNKQLATLKTSLATQDYETARRVGMAALSPPPPFSIFSEASVAQRHIETINFDLLVNLLQRITAHDFVAVRGLLAKRDEEIAKYKTATLSQAGQVIEAISNQLEAIESQTVNIDTIAAELETKQRILTEIHKTYLGLRLQLANLLGLPSSADTGENAIYSSGVLQGLPTLDRLPDGLPDLAELKLELQSLGGGVKIDAPNPYEIFTVRIEELKKQTAALVADGNEISTAVEALMRNSDESQARIKHHFDAIIRLAQDRLAAPQADLVERLKEHFLSFVTAILRS